MVLCASTAGCGAVDRIARTLRTGYPEQGIRPVAGYDASHERGGEQRGGASLSAQLGQVLFGFLNTGIRSFPVPPFRFGEIFRDAIAVFITPAHLELCNGIPLFSSLSVPLYGFCVVLFDAFAIIIAAAQILLCNGISLFYGLTEPLYGFCVVLFDAFAPVIAGAQIELCTGIPLFSGLSVPLYGLGVVLFDALPFL